MVEKIKNLEALLTTAGINGKVIDQDVSYLVNPGENYGSLLLKLDIKLKTDSKDETLHTVAKCVPQCAATQEFFQTELTFKNELAWYSELAPTYHEYVKQLGLEETANMFAKFYGGRINLNTDSNVVDEDGVIVVENLTKSGFEVVNRRVGFNYDTAKVVLKTLSRFHAISIAIKQKDPTFYNTKIKPVLDNILPEDFSFDLDLTFFDNDPQIKHLKQRVAKNIRTFNPYGHNDQPLSNPWISVCHNDFWVNNIMVEKQIPPAYAKILDLQVCVEKSVIADVVFFLLSSIELKTIKNHLDEFLSYYHASFVDVLKQLNVDISPYSYEEFLKECNYHGHCGQFGHAFYHTFYILAEKVQNQKYAFEEGFDLVELFRQINSNLSKNHIDKFNWLVLEAAKRNLI